MGDDDEIEIMGENYEDDSEKSLAFLREEAGMPRRRRSDASEKRVGCL